MNLIDNVLIGPLRLLLLFGAVLVVHQIVTRQHPKAYDLDFILKRTVFYGSLVLLVIFILIQLNMYDIFSLLAIFFIILGIQYLQIKNLKHPAKQIRKKRRYFLLGFFKIMENNPTFRSLIENNLRIFHAKKINFVLVMAFLCSLAVFISRYLFLKNDMYTLSSLWSKNLDIIKGFNMNQWFLNDNNLLGELALINFYSKITGLSEEMAIHSFGLIENSILGIVLYWIIFKISKSKFFAPIIGVLFFAFFYKYLPININLLLEHNSLYLALCFALPATMFTVVPRILIVSERNYFLVLMVIFSAIAFINFFVSFIVLPIFLLIALLLYTKKTLPFIVKSIFAFVSGTGITLGAHAIGCYINNISFESFLKGNMILVESYTHFPQLAFDLDMLVMAFVFFGVITLMAILPLYFQNRRKWTPALVFSVFVTAFIFIKDWHLTWVDTDLYYQTLSTVMVIQLGLFVGCIQRYSQFSIPRRPIYRLISLTMLFFTMTFTSFAMNGFFRFKAENINELKSDVLKIYHKLSSEYLPYSYAVVNQRYGIHMSQNEHHFINYGDFLEKYIQRDSVYHANKTNEEFLKKNSDYILPNSVFVFVAKDNVEETKYNLYASKEISEQLLSHIGILRRRGRDIKLFYDDDYLTVYEIVNQEKSSKLDDLIFKL